MNEVKEIETPLPVPDNITRDWVENAIEAGEIEHGGKTLFAQSADVLNDNPVWVTDNYGMPESGSEDSGLYAYHATDASHLPSYLDNGLVIEEGGTSLSSSHKEQVANAAKGTYSSIDTSMIVVWKPTYNDVVPIEAMGEMYYHPKKKFEGTEDDIPKNMRGRYNEAKSNGKDFVQLPPDSIIGVFFVDQKKQKDAVKEKLNL